MPIAVRRQRFMRTVITSAVLAVVLLTCVGPTLVGGLLAVVPTFTGMQHLKTAQTQLKSITSHPFDLELINSAHDELAAANRDFTAANGGLQIIPGLVNWVPFAGSRFGGAQRVMPIAINATQAGMLACDALKIMASKLKNPMDTTGPGLTLDDVTAMTEKFNQIKAIFDQIAVQVANLQPSDADLDSRLGPLLTSAKSQLPEIVQTVNDLDATMPALPTLLGIGQPTKYLLAVMDSTEIRPSGGFIGNDGFVTITGGHLGDIHMEDVDLLDKQVKHGIKTIEIPYNYNWFLGFPTWGFRDSNLDADFPTSAQNGQQLYAREAAPNAEVVHGVIAITPWLIQNALRVTGGIKMPEYNNDVITADNLVEKIHYWQLNIGGAAEKDPISGSSQRKRFSGLLFKHFMETVKANAAQDMGPLIKLLIDSMKSKDLQIYLNNASAEALLTHRHLGGTIEAPPTGDSLFVVNANWGATKSDAIVKHVLSDVVTIDESGTATHTTTITNSWPKDPKTLTQTYPANPWEAGVNRVYQRIYIPQSSRVSKTGITGLSPTWPPIAKPVLTAASAPAFDRQVWGGYVDTFYTDKTPRTITFTWTTPNAAKRDSTGWHYNYLIQRQAGIFYTADTSINLPQCANVTSTSSGLVTSGKSLAVPAQDFLHDWAIRINYTC